jgi:bifunctional DNA-binding transcriptional regulator/antitoxin component of YhaV-PrlF toxin-antitoxin module
MAPAYDRRVAGLDAGDVVNHAGRGFDRLYWSSKLVSG